MHNMNLFGKHNSHNMGVTWLPRSQQILNSKKWVKGLSRLKVTEIAPHPQNQEKADKIFKK